MSLDEQRVYLLAGHSHAKALGLPSDLPSGDAKLEKLAVPGVTAFGLTGTVPRLDSYWDQLVSHAAEKTVLLSWNGNQHLAKFLFASVPPFDFHLKRFPDLKPEKGLFVVSESQVRELLGKGNSNLRPVLSRLRQVAGCKPVVVGTPPPKGNDQQIRGLLATEPHFVNTAKKLGVEINSIPFTSGEVRKKLWLVVQDLLQEAAEAEKCNFIPVPAEAMDQNGFLHQRYARSDVTHANEAFGDLMWRHILAKKGSFQ